MKKWQARISYVLIVGLMLSIVLITLTQVFARYVLNSSLIWAEELSRLLFVWLVLVGASITEHMKIRVLARKKILRKPLLWVTRVSEWFCLLVLLWGGMKLQATFRSDYYSTFHLSRSWYFLSVVVGSILWAFSTFFEGMSQTGEDVQ